MSRKSDKAYGFRAWLLQLIGMANTSLITNTATQLQADGVQGRSRWRRSSLQPALCAPAD
jgi:hypothetical protein